MIDHIRLVFRIIVKPTANHFSKKAIFSKDSFEQDISVQNLCVKFIQPKYDFVARQVHILAKLLFKENLGQLEFKK